MKKRYLPFVAVLSLVLIGAGCGSSQAPTTPSDDSQAQGQEKTVRDDGAGTSTRSIAEVEKALGLELPDDAVIGIVIENAQAYDVIFSTKLSRDEAETFYKGAFQQAGLRSSRPWGTNSNPVMGDVTSATYTSGNLVYAVFIREKNGQTEIEITRQ